MLVNVKKWTLINIGFSIRKIECTLNFYLLYMADNTTVAAPELKAVVEELPFTTDTHATQVSTPSDDTTGHVGETQEVSTTAPIIGTPDVNEEEEKIRDARYAGTLEKERVDKRAKEEQLTNYTNWIAKDPSRTKQALIEIDNMSEAEADSYVSQLRTAGYWGGSTQNTQQQAIAPNFDSNKIKEEVKNELRLEDQRNTGYKKYFDTVPTMNPQNVKTEDIDDAKVLANAVEYRALQMVNKNPELDFGEALVTAHKKLTGQNDEQIKAAREAGRLEGLVQTNVSNSSSVPGSTGQQVKSSIVNISASDRAAADRQGIDPALYAKYKGQKITIVD